MFCQICERKNGRVRATFKINVCAYKAKSEEFLELVLNSKSSKSTKINRKFRVPRKQGAHFLGAGAQIQDSCVFS
jgi:hypothetical protein